jgi:hypothetical protein
LAAKREGKAQDDGHRNGHRIRDEGDREATTIHRANLLGWLIKVHAGFTEPNEGLEDDSR